MQFDGFPIEKWRAQFTGAIDIEEREGMAMRTDRVVVMVVATRIRKSVPEALDEDGALRITRQNKIEHLAVLEGDQREAALKMLAGTERGFAESLFDAPMREVDPETGEIKSAGYADTTPPTPEPVVTPPTPAVLLDNDAIPPQNDGVYEAPSMQEITPEPVPPEEQDAYFDVPAIKDDSQPVGTGPIKQHAPTGNGSSGGDGMRVAPTDFSELASITTPGAPTRDSAAAPVGEVVGQVRQGPRKDKILEDFFNEEIEHE